jgi:hypothetical protein
MRDAGGARKFGRPTSRKRFLACVLRLLRRDREPCGRLLISGLQDADPAQEILKTHIRPQGIECWTQQDGRFEA